MWVQIDLSVSSDEALGMGWFVPLSYQVKCYMSTGSWVSRAGWGTHITKWWRTMFAGRLSNPFYWTAITCCMHPGMNK